MLVNLQVQSRELHQLQLIADYVSNVMSPIMPAAFVVPPVSLYQM